MPRTQIRGTQVRKGSVTTAEIADGAVTTQKLSNDSVSERKLSRDVAERLFSISSPVGRLVIQEDTPPHTDIIIPNNFTNLSVSDFLERVMIIVDGQLMYNGQIVSGLIDDPVDVYLGTLGNALRFTFTLRRGSKVQVVYL